MCLSDVVIGRLSGKSWRRFCGGMLKFYQCDTFEGEVIYKVSSFKKLLHKRHRHLTFIFYNGYIP